MNSLKDKLDRLPEELLNKLQGKSLKEQNKILYEEIQKKAKEILRDEEIEKSRSKE